MIRGGVNDLVGIRCCSTKVVEMKFPVDPPSNIIDAAKFLLIFAFIFIKSDDVAVVVFTELIYNGVDEGLFTDSSGGAPSSSTESVRFPSASY